jgi:hypothetical protein
LLEIVPHPLCPTDQRQRPSRGLAPHAPKTAASMIGRALVASRTVRPFPMRLARPCPVDHRLSPFTDSAQKNGGAHRAPAR